MGETVARGVRSRLAARFARVRLGLALGEGAGLALAGAKGLVKLTPEAVVFRLQVLNASLKSLTGGTTD